MFLRSGLNFAPRLAHDSRVEKLKFGRPGLSPWGHIRDTEPGQCHGQGLGVALAGTDNAIHRSPWPLMQRRGPVRGIGMVCHPHPWHSGSATVTDVAWAWHQRPRKAIYVVFRDGICHAQVTSVTLRISHCHGCGLSVTPETLVDEIEMFDEILKII